MRGTAIVKCLIVKGYLVGKTEKEIDLKPGIEIEKRVTFLVGMMTEATGDEKGTMTEISITALRQKDGDPADLTEMNATLQLVTKGQ